MPRVLTIGVYGSNRETFFEALESAKVDVLLDIRRRRAVRGPHYAFANARRLIAELEARDIAYRHVLGLAPSPEMLEAQHATDARAGLRYSERMQLSKAYVARYVPEILERFDFEQLAGELRGLRAPVLMCVERVPSACHRSLVAPRLARALGASRVVDLLPKTSPDTPHRRSADSDP